MTSHRVEDVVPSNDTPIRRRVTLRPPSHPTTYRGPHGFVTVREFDRHTVIGFRAAFHPPVPGHLDVVESVQPDQQFGVDHRLNEPVALGPAETRIGRGHFGQQPALGIDEPQDLVGPVCGSMRSTRPIDWNVRRASSSRPTPRG